MTNAASDSHLVRIEHAQKRYGSRLVLNIDDLTLVAGDRLMIYGQNGSGKSTLLRLILGVSSPTNGLIERSESFIGARVGYLPQSGGLYPELSLRDNLRLRAEVEGRHAGEVDNWQPVKELGLQAFLHRRFGELSGGYQRLAGLAAAMINAPDCLILDEPFAGMDRVRREMVQKSLASYSAEALLLVIAVPEREDIPFITRELAMVEGDLQ